MRLAIGFAGDRGQAAEPELVRCRIADRPFAGPFGQFHQAQLAGALFDLADRGQRLGADLIGRGLRRQRLAGRHDGPAVEIAGGDGRGGFRLGLGPGLGGCGGSRLGLGRRLGCRFRRGGGWRSCGGRLGLGGRGCGLGRLVVAVRQAQPVDLADHGIAGHTAQFLGDLAGRLSLGPHAFQRLDALIGPGHGLPFLHRGRTRCPSLW